MGEAYLQNLPSIHLNNILFYIKIELLFFLFIITINNFIKNKMGTCFSSNQIHDNNEDDLQNTYLIQIEPIYIRGKRYLIDKHNMQVYDLNSKRFIGIYNSYRDFIERC